MKDNKDRKKAQKGTLLKVLKRIKKYSGFLILSILMAAVTVASTLYVPILVGRGIDHIVGPGNVDFCRYKQNSCDDRSYSCYNSPVTVDNEHM